LLPILITYSFLNELIGKEKAICRRAIFIILMIISVPFSYLLSIIFLIPVVLICDIIQISRNLTGNNLSSNEKKLKGNRKKINPLDEKSFNERKNGEAAKNLLLLDSAENSKITSSTKQENYFHNKEMIIVMQD
jgi:hypothetical protein